MTNPTEPDQTGYQLALNEDDSLTLTIPPGFPVGAQIRVIRAGVKRVAVMTDRHVYITLLQAQEAKHES